MATLERFWQHNPTRFNRPVLASPRARKAACTVSHFSFHRRRSRDFSRRKSFLQRRSKRRDFVLVNEGDTRDTLLPSKWYSPQYARGNHQVRENNCSKKRLCAGLYNSKRVGYSRYLLTLHFWGVNSTFYEFAFGVNSTQVKCVRYRGCT